MFKSEIEFIKVFFLILMFVLGVVLIIIPLKSGEIDLLNGSRYKLIDGTITQKETYESGISGTRGTTAKKLRLTTIHYEYIIEGRTYNNSNIFGWITPFGDNVKVIYNVDNPGKSELLMQIFFPQNGPYIFYGIILIICSIGKFIGINRKKNSKEI